MRIFVNFFVDKKVRGFIWGVVLATSLLVNSSIVYSKNAEQIILVTSKTGGAYQVFVDSFSEEYFNKVKADSRFEIKNISISRLSSDRNDWKYKNALVVTVGTKAAKFVADMKLDSPVIHAMLPFSAYKKIESKRKVCSKQSAIYIDQPIKRQLALSKIIFPNRHRYGFLLGDTSKKRYEIERQEHHFSTKKIETSLIEESRELAWSLRDLSDDVDVFIALNDPLVFNPNNAKWFLYMAYQEEKPVIGFSKPYVSAGASAAVYSTPAQLGMQAAKQLIQQQLSKNECLFKPQYPHNFSISVNKAVVESLSGRALSEEMLHQYLVEKEKARK